MLLICLRRPIAAAHHLTQSQTCSHIVGGDTATACFRLLSPHELQLATDRMGWQAAYTGGALLMPHYSVKLWVGEIAMPEAKVPTVEAESDLGRAAIQSVTRRCQVSEQAARVRLVQLGLLSQA
jgi:hypothetical protein